LDATVTDPRQFSRSPFAWLPPSSRTISLRAMPRLDAVLPLTLRDVERAEILRSSLSKYFPELGTLWIVVPDPQLPAIREALRKQKVEAQDLRLVPETEIVPEFRLTPTLRGWYKQQVIKLAIAEHVASRAYLTLDADVICTRPFTVAEAAPDLVPYFVIPEDRHPRWYRHTEAALGMKAIRKGVVHNVTPAILVRDAVLEIRDYFEHKPLILSVRGVKQAIALGRSRFGKKVKFARWRLMLAAGAPWTEYALYYTYLEATGHIRNFHVETAQAIYDIERSCWQNDKDNFGEWDPAPCFEGQGPPWFVVVQSNTQLDPAIVWDKVERYLKT